MYPVGYDVNSFVSPSGERFVPQYVGDVKTNGFIQLVEVGKIDVAARAAAGADSCDINKIVERFRDGDITVLNRVQGSYADVSGLPNNLRGVLDMARGLETSFDSLPSEIKEKFGSFDNWINSAGSQEWFDAMKPSVSDSDSKEVSDNGES